jgi:RNA polymerase sigma factor (sigma-70 family)
MDQKLVRGFPATRHSALAALRGAQTRERALETLLSIYWRPVYSYLRLRWRRPHEEAADLAQEFFADVVEKEILTRFDPARARLRTFLRACVDGLVSNHDRAAGRRKRTFDLESVRDELFAGSVAESPEEIFEREWARAVFAKGLSRLRDECAKSGKPDHYALFERYDLAGERTTYAELARESGIPVTDVTNRLSRTRRELRRIVLDILRESTGSEEELREEARALFRGNGA